MFYHKITADLTAQQITDVKNALETINQNLPFLVNLNRVERKQITKMGPKSADFVHESQQTMINYPQVLPASFSKEDYTQDIYLYNAVSDIKRIMDSLSEKVNDTAMALGSRTMAGSLEVYDYVQTAAPRIPGLKSVAEKLRQRFKNQGKKRNDPPAN